MIKLKASKINPIAEIYKNNDYNDNEIIQLTFYVNGEDKLTFQCKLEELTRNAINRFIQKRGLQEEKDILFIVGNKRLKMNIPIGENGLRNHSKIIVIYGFKCS